MNAKIKLVTHYGIPAELSIVDNGVYVGLYILTLLVQLKLEDKVIGNEACLTDSECRELVRLFILQ